MQLQKVAGIDPSMWPYRVHVRHALSSMQLQKVVGIDPSMWPYRVHVRHAIIYAITKCSWHTPISVAVRVHVRHALSCNYKR